MTASDNRELARRFFEDFCTGRRRDLADTLMTPDYVYHDPQVPNVQGPQGMAQAVAVYQEELDGHWNIEEIIPAGEDRVVVRWTGIGTHNTEFMGLPPTGKSARVAAISVLRIAGGKIAEHWCVWDTLGLLQQLGAAPMPAQAA